MYEYNPFNPCRIQTSVEAVMPVRCTTRPPHTVLVLDVYGGARKLGEQGKPIQSPATWTCNFAVMIFLDLVPM